MFRLVLVASVFALAVGSISADDNFFESKIRPLFIKHCNSCHSEQAKKVKGDLKLDTKLSLTKGGSSGALWVKNDPDKSILIQAVKRNHKEVSAMPPDAELSKDDVALLVEWIQLGSPIPDDVAPTKKKETIAEAKARWPYTPLPKATEFDIDVLLQAKLDEKKLKPLGPTDKATLLRRVTYTLTGLPPTIAEQDEFAKDTSAKAFENVIDRLLTTPQYGERWGRHWLDVVRYADTAGDNADFPIPQQYLYRNWVIEAFNKDLPYDTFVMMQLAGDLLGEGSDEIRKQGVIATGYIANARRFGSRVDDYPTHLTIEDTIDNFGRAFLGQTLNCARCHDHKFDPLSMKDYYALYGIFNSTRYPWPGIELEQRQRDLVPLVPEAEARKVIDERNEKNKEFEARIKQMFAEKSKAPDKEKEAIQKKIDEVKKEQKKIVNAAWPYPTAYAVSEAKTRGDSRIQMKGDPTKESDVVRRGFPEVLGGQKLSDINTASGRLQLARWLTSANNPLFARVIVNRVWMQHFGKGLVPTPNDFGLQGAKPTHPELLDALARWFIDNKYSFKALHKKLLLTAAYQRSSTGEVPGADTADPNNDLLWAFRLRRLDAEQIRDTLLQVSGHLDSTPGGEHPFPNPTTWNFTQHNPFRAVYDTKRRSVYLMTQRIQRHPYLALFDGADTSASTGNRITSTTALQSLYFLNDPFVHERAAGVAERAQKAGETDEERIAVVYRWLFARTASTEEITAGTEYLKKASALSSSSEAWPSYIRTLFRLNELVYLK
jgi:Protein of unknown function (DUF1553)/Protein of unknown function (DUF1549)/Planctomycete cytochrome C